MLKTLVSMPGHQLVECIVYQHHAHNYGSLYRKLYYDMILEQLIYNHTKTRNNSAFLTLLLFGGILFFCDTAMTDCTVLLCVLCCLTSFHGLSLRGPWQSSKKERKRGIIFFCKHSFMLVKEGSGRFCTPSLCLYHRCVHVRFAKIKLITEIIWEPPTRFSQSICQWAGEIRGRRC